MGSARGAAGHFPASPRSCKARRAAPERADVTGIAPPGLPDVSRRPRRPIHDREGFTANKLFFLHERKTLAIMAAASGYAGGLADDEGQDAAQGRHAGDQPGDVVVDHAAPEAARRRREARARLVAAPQEREAGASTEAGASRGLPGPGGPRPRPSHRAMMTDAAVTVAGAGAYRAAGLAVQAVRAVRAVRRCGRRSGPGTRRRPGPRSARPPKLSAPLSCA